MVKDRTRIPEFTDLTQEDQGGFPVNSPDCQVLDQSVISHLEKYETGVNDKYQKRKPSQRTIFSFVNEVLSSCGWRSSTFETGLIRERRSHAWDHWETEDPNFFPELKYCKQIWNAERMCVTKFMILILCIYQRCQNIYIFAFLNHFIHSRECPCKLSVSWKRTLWFSRG